ncbi:MAG: tRNA uridine-5-carboxymethylaminomethyl(34) synthesis GTPase MnmE [Bacteroidota bacterium]|nr:tRNA uridine-5-carboxymethylaminomethyl(34) synthesis GTPase MnmE [Bacteroidota bacterium]
MNNLSKETICALSTGGSISAIAIIRLSGLNAIKICNSIFSKNIINVPANTIHYGEIKNKKQIIDQVIISIFKAPQSYTGEDIVEISCHGSIFIQKEILRLLITQGARLAKAGEFTMRAFQNGKIDLSQAEAVADLIASESKAAHETALNQLKGGFSKELQVLRSKLIDFASLVELELDFSEEDVEFADRKKLLELLSEIQKHLTALIDSFKLGNVLKNGIPVSILGPPNTGKSTLLNLLFNEEKAIVSEIAGTTRDIIEDKLIINDIQFRFIDTAGLRETKDTIEKIGIQKTLEQAEKSQIIIYLFDASRNIEKQQKELKKITKKDNILLVVNKIDLNKEIKTILGKGYIYISAKQQIGINKLKDELIKHTEINKLSNNETIVTNIRHYEELKLTLNEIEEVINGVNKKISGDLLATNIRQSLWHLGSITGEINTDDLLENIFRNFCIGK